MVQTKKLLGSTLKQIFFKIRLRFKEMLFCFVVWHSIFGILGNLQCAQKNVYICIRMYIYHGGYFIIHFKR